jgi:hypothetical protein
MKEQITSDFTPTYFSIRLRKETTLQLSDYKLVTLNLNSVNQLIVVMVKCGVLFEVRTEFLNNI